MLGIALSWIMGLLGFIFAGVFMFGLVSQFYDTKYRRFETGPA
jgi:Ca2+-dependent lipid-binding protein